MLRLILPQLNILPRDQWTDAQKVDSRLHCPDGQLRCLDCNEKESDYCSGRNFGCGPDDYNRIRIVELERTKIQQIRSQTVEECAKLCDNNYGWIDGEYFDALGDGIRVKMLGLEYTKGSL